MLINYWDCNFTEYDEWFDEYDLYRNYMCTHPESKTGQCDLDNKWFGHKAECKFNQERKIK